jgi:2-keto-4-pentenoate hydratase/2-oxohepta-3-ene-1,7-dioic acid hydratase in catechol pathway
MAMEKHGLAMYANAAGLRLAAVVGGEVFDLAEVAAALGQPSPPAATLSALISRWEELGGGVERLLQQAIARAPAMRSLKAKPLESLRVPFQPPRIFAAAANYSEHAKEMGTKLSAKPNSKPYMFMKADSAVIGPGEAVIMPPQSQQVDWEVELAAVIGKTCRGVTMENALEYVAGYTVLNDVSARDLNVRSDFPFKFDWFQGKSFDTFAPLGPCFVPRRWIEDPQRLGLQLSVNGQRMQDGSTAQMIFSVAEQVAYLSSMLTLRPGDSIATGTPTGVGASRGIFLKDGDVMEASIEGIGTLRNPVRAY